MSYQLVDIEYDDLNENNSNEELFIIRLKIKVDEYQYRFCLLLENKFVSQEVYNLELEHNNEYVDNAILKYWYRNMVVV